MSRRPPRDPGDFSDLDSAQRIALAIAGVFIALAAFALWWFFGESAVAMVEEIGEAVNL